MQVTVEIVNAFIAGQAGGNPAGVVLDADDLSPAQKLQIARKVGLSETAFVSKSAIASVKLEFFTPERQIAHCGHATIATFCRLKELGLVTDGQMSKETIDGVREIIVDGEMAYMEQKAPSYRDIADKAEILASLNARASDVAETGIVNTGNSFLLAHVPDVDTLRGLRPDFARIAAISEKYDLIGYYVYSTQTEQAGRHASTRMFAPRYGIEEESATGMAAGPLACHLHDKMGVMAQPILIEQGRLMATPSPSVIRVDLRLQDGAIASLLAGGKGRAMRRMVIEV